MQKLDGSKCMVRFKERRSIIDLDRLTIVGILVYELDIFFLFREVVRMISVWYLSDIVPEIYERA